ncbi:glycosyltransferase, partial [Actinomyces sp.]|uniref:glycosyltransferase family 2 protein n=1 Tax=Actinomyces sp. TaxID=29317 RepID=UPI0025C160A0
AEKAEAEAIAEKLAGITDTRMSIVSASRPGLSRARNRGVLAARGEVIVFTDDDAIVDPHWLTAMIDPFTASPYVAATTGIALPLEERYKAQRWFESRGGFPKDMSPRVWCVGDVPSGLEALGEKGDGGPLFPITTARVGAGVCMAMRRDVLMEVGPFDPALGAGTSTRGGEDLDMFARILATGDVIVHTPDALVHHRHRVDEAGLDKQIRGNGSGMAALLTKAIIDKPSVLGTLIGRIPGILKRIKPGGARVAGTDDDVPGSLTKSEIKGFLEGPFLYLSSRRRNKLVAPSRDARAADPAQGAPTGTSDGGDAPASSGESGAPEGSSDA